MEYQAIFCCFGSGLDWFASVGGCGCLLIAYSRYEVRRGGTDGVTGRNDRWHNKRETRVADEINGPSHRGTRRLMLLHVRGQS